MEGVGKIFAIQCYDNYETYKKYITSYVPLLHEAEIRGKSQKILTYNHFSDYKDKITSTKEFSTLNEGLNEYFRTTITSNVINEKKKELVKYVDTQIKKFEKMQRDRKSVV